ncbi:hypothetical protein [Pseudomonas aeruginosa]|uniref:hypothetical protein n=1 Tax=Pseudomonas aeruginosa TaxID=287 RepID=UPI001E418B99|nr:hypothetical protein [Pseudomonas aeruginosa]MCD2949338.1 hypothetical protein [Pseudomonas aeruginosa]
MSNEDWNELDESYRSALSGALETAHPAVEQAGANVGHGHVFPRADGVKMRCGGPGLCSECTADASRARAALAQPSPLQSEQAEAERPEVAEVAFVLRNIGAMDAEDIDGDNVDLRFEDAEGRDTGCDVSIVEYAEKAADLFEQHDRIVGALRAEITQLRQHKNDYMDAGQETYRALQNEIREREAEIARLDGLVSSRTTERDAALAEVERLRESKGDPVGSLEKCMKVMYERDEHAKRLEAAQAQHGVPEGWKPVPIEPLLNMMSDKDHDTRIMAERQLLSILAAAPVCRLSRSALTEAQMRRLYENSTETENERLGFEAFARLIRRAEAVHQIAAAPAQGGETDEH